VKLATSSNPTEGKVGWHSNDSIRLSPKPEGQCFQLILNVNVAQLRRHTCADAEFVVSLLCFEKICVRVLWFFTHSPQTNISSLALI